MVWARCFIRTCRCEEYGNKARERGGSIEGNHHTVWLFCPRARRKRGKNASRARTRDGKKFDPRRVGDG